jgi:hypothetical protein
MQPHERGEEAHLVFRADADAIIRHFNAAHAWGYGRCHGNLGRHTRRYKDQRVGQEVGQRVLEQRRISVEDHFVSPDGDPGIPSLDLSLQLSQTAGDDAMQRHPPPPDGAVAEPSKVQEGRD